MGKSRFLLFSIAGAVLAGSGTAESRRRPPAQPPTAVVVHQRPRPLPLRSFELLARIADAYAPRWDEVDLLIEQAEKAYAAGMQDYRAGDFEQAKQDFDRGLNLLLESKLDIPSHDRLSAEFDKLVENIYAAEGAALERGDMLSAQKYEPAPLESFEGLTFPVDPNVKARVAREVGTVHSDLPLESNDVVAGVINYLQTTKGGQNFMHRVLSRIGLYRPMISEALQEEGLPQDLIYLAGPESAFNPFALSKAGAKGIWQLMPARAADYGLKKDPWVDEREDPLKSTHAALRHLKDLYNMFGDWYLAMAAYDWGPAGVQKVIEKTGYADYWTLRGLHAFPRETENYVPIILATAFIAKDPKGFGFDVEPNPPLSPDHVTVTVPTDLRLVAQLIDRPVDDLIQLNPSLLRWTTPANDPKFVLNLPQGTGAPFEEVVASIPPNKRIWWRAHKVEEGDTLWSIAKKFRVSPASLAAANRIDRNAPLESGSHLVVPLAPGKEASLVRVHEHRSLLARYYRVRPGDTLELISDRFDVTPYQIRRWNNLRTSRLVAGKTLKVYLPGRKNLRSQHARRRRSTTSHIAQKITSPPKAPADKTTSKTASKAPTPGA